MGSTEVVARPMGGFRIGAEQEGMRRGPFEDVHDIEKVTEPKT